MAAVAIGGRGQMARWRGLVAGLVLAGAAGGLAASRQSTIDPSAVGAGMGPLYAVSLDERTGECSVGPASGSIAGAALVYGFDLEAAQVDVCHEYGPRYR